MSMQTLRVLNGPIAICRLAADADTPEWVPAQGFCSMTRTLDELSIVCAAEVVPGEVRAERDWRMLQVRGPLDFELTGVLQGLLAPLAEAQVPVFALSTYDTDYLLVRERHLEAACAALVASGHRVETHHA